MVLRIERLFTERWQGLCFQLLTGFLGGSRLPFLDAGRSANKTCFQFLKCGLFLGWTILDWCYFQSWVENGGTRVVRKTVTAHVQKQDDWSDRKGELDKIAVLVCSRCQYIMHHRFLIGYMTLHVMDLYVFIQPNLSRLFTCFRDHLLELQCLKSLAKSNIMYRQDTQSHWYQVTFLVMIFLITDCSEI